ncbi:MAG: hypothetical protein Q8Q14_16195 [Gemmatimonadales bacterium]|nr:hypothetical protein [Gemmatimonadales bacterium]
MQTVLLGIPPEVAEGLGLSPAPGGGHLPPAGRVPDSFGIWHASPQIKLRKVERLPLAWDAGQGDHVAQIRVEVMDLDIIERRLDEVEAELHRREAGQRYRAGGADIRCDRNANGQVRCGDLTIELRCPHDGVGPVWAIQRTLGMPDGATHTRLDEGDIRRLVVAAKLAAGAEADDLRLVRGHRAWAERVARPCRRSAGAPLA